MRFISIVSKILITFIMLILHFGCSDPVEYTDEDTTPTTTTTGMLRFIQSASTVENLVLDYRDLDTDTWEPFLTNAKYGSQYGYYNFRTGKREFAAFEPNTSFIIAKGSFELEEDKKYSIIAYDYEATINPGFMILEDTLATADSTVSFVRFLHLGSDVDTITIENMNNAETLVELAREEHSSYFNLPAQTYSFVVRSKSPEQTLLNNVWVTFLSGVTYTVIISGSINGMTPVDLNMNILQDVSIRYITVD